MAESPPDLSLTPPGTPLSASPRYHQTQHQHPHHHHQQQPHHPQHQLNNSQTNLMEDPDTEGARTPKRQRVDSGSGARESLSIEAASSASASAAAAAASAASFVPAIRKTPEPSPNRPAKVTINMKSPTSEIEPDLNAQPQTETQIQTQTQTRHTSSQTPIDPPQSPPDATPTPITTSNAISASASASVSAAASPSSTPEESPQIEIADPEDMEQDPNSSNWRPLEEVVCESSQPEIIDLSDMTALVDSFPLIRADVTAYESLIRFRQILDRGMLFSASAPKSICILNIHYCISNTNLLPGHIGETGVVLQKLQPWMAYCARNLDRLTLQAYVDHVDFWENLPTIVEKILRRRYELT